MLTMYKIWFILNDITFYWKDLPSFLLKQIYFQKIVTQLSGNFSFELNMAVITRRHQTSVIHVILIPNNISRA